MNDDLFPPPAHEALIETLARRAEDELREKFAALRRDIEQRFKHIEAFHRRSIAQRRRFWRLRILQEKTA